MQELQDQIVKISGARLPIVTQPTGHAVKIFVGASALSPLKADSLQYGAYRMAMGVVWMALIAAGICPLTRRTPSATR